MEHYKQPVTISQGKRRDREKSIKGVIKERVNLSLNSTGEASSIEQLAIFLRNEQGQYANRLLLIGDGFQKSLFSLFLN